MAAVKPLKLASGRVAQFGATDTVPAANLPVLTKSFTLENPAVGDLFHIFTTQVALTLSRMEAFLKGSSTPSVTWKIRYGSDPSAAGTVVVTAGTTTTVTGSIQSITSFDNSTPGIGTAIWMEITAVSGTVTEFHATLFF